MRVRACLELAPSLTPRSDTAESHLAWVRTPRKRGGLGHMQIPLLADVTKEISASYGTLLKDAGIALRGLFIIDPTGTLQQVTINNLPGASQVWLWQATLCLTIAPLPQWAAMSTRRCVSCALSSSWRSTARCALPAGPRAQRL